MSSGASAKRRPTPPPGRNLTLILALCALVGTILFVIELTGDHPVRAWQALHVNFVYWTGLAFVGPVIAAIFQLTGSRWGQRVRRLAECSVALLPLSLLSFVGVALGHHTLAPAARELDNLPEAKQIWLDPTFLLARDGVALLLLAILVVAFVRPSLRVDFGAPPDGFKPPRNGLTAWLTRGFKGYEVETERARHLQSTLAPIVLITYAVVFSLIAFDQVMALDPHWISTLFGGYVFITTLFLGWAALSAIAVAASERKGRDAFSLYGRAITVDDRHDLGKLLFAFCMLSADFFWSQFVVIWYANIPEETPFLIRRVREEPWSTVSWAVLIFCFGLPFVLLLSKRIKRSKTALFGIAVLVMVMVWLERFLLVAPSTWIDHHGQPLPGLPLHYTEVGVTLAFLGLAGLLYRWALTTLVVPPRPAPNPAREGDEDSAEEVAHA